MLSIESRECLWPWNTHVLFKSVPKSYRLRQAVHQEIKDKVRYLRSSCSPTPSRVQKRPGRSPLTCLTYPALQSVSLPGQHAPGTAHALALRFPGLCGRWGGFHPFGFDPLCLPAPPLPLPQPSAGPATLTRRWQPAAPWAAVPR